MLKKNIKKWKKTILFGVGIVFLALLLRLYRLDYLPVFADEAIYIRWAQIMKSESTLRFLPLSDGKQPLYMWSVIPFLKLIGDPLIAGRVFLHMLYFLTGSGWLTPCFQCLEFGFFIWVF